MEFEEYTHAFFITKNIPVEIIDKSLGKDGRYYYYVESDIKGYVDDPDQCFDSIYPIYCCTGDELVPVDN